MPNKTVATLEKSRLNAAMEVWVRAKHSSPGQIPMGMNSLSIVFRCAFSIALLLALCGCGTPVISEKTSAPYVIDHTANTPSVCELHGLPMVKTRVSLHASGFAGSNHDYSLCPNAKRPIDTGCFSHEPGDYGFIWVCPTCEQVYEQQQVNR